MVSLSTSPMEISKGDQLTVKMSHVDEKFGTVGYPVEFKTYERYDGPDIHVPRSFRGEVHSVEISYGSEHVLIGEIEKTLRNKKNSKKASISRGTILSVKIDRKGNSGNHIGYPIGKEYQDHSLSVHLSTGEPGEEFEVKILSVDGHSAKAQLTEDERKQRKKEQKRQEKKEQKEREKRIERKRKKSEEERADFMEENGEEILEEALSHDGNREQKQVTENEDEDWDERTKETRKDLMN